MKTTKRVIDDSQIDAGLIRAVVRQIGDKKNLNDVYNHGANAGYPGFTYYNDTVKFFKNHRKAIVAMVENMADDLGEAPIDMVANFNCLAGRQLRGNGTYGHDTEHSKAVRELYPSVSRCLYGGRMTDDDTTVANALAWFALEEVARAFCDE